MRALVTGGAGFIGSHLCARLVHDGDSVVCVDNLVTGDRANLSPLFGNARFRYVQHDVIEPLHWAESEEFDAIFHLASPASPVGYFRQPLATALVNSVGTKNALDLAKRNRARFLLASTSEVYGDPLEHPQRESYWGNVNPIGPRSPYDEGKRFGEAITMIYAREDGLDARIVRIFNCYGPHSNPEDGRIVPNFITQALTNRPLTIYGTGNQTRALGYVSDLVDGLLRAIATPGTTGKVFNLGNPEEHTVREIAETIRKLADSRSEIVYSPPRDSDDPQRRCPDITRARAELGWSPRVGLEEGLGLTIAWMRDRLALGR